MSHVTDSLSAYLDRELPPEERRRVDEHLPACVECRARLDELASLSRLLSSIPKAPVPAGMLRSLRTRRAARAQAPAFPLFLSNRQAAFVLAGFAGVIVAYDAVRNRLPETVELAPAASVAPEAPRAAPRPAAAKALPAAAKAAAPRPTNEQLNAFLENEKRRMGIRQVLPQRSAADLAHPAALGGFQGAPRAAYLNGSRPGLLKAAPLGAPEHPLTLEALEQATGPAPGVWAMDPAELADIWRRFAIPRPAPGVDFARDMLIVATALRDQPAEILSIQQESARILVRYRVSASPAATSYPAAAVPRSDLPVIFELAQ